MKLISINNRRYIGSKARMVDYINDVMKKEKITFSSFFDLFGGTGIVGYYFNDSKTKIYVNDLLKSNYDDVKNQLLANKLISDNYNLKLANWVLGPNGYPTLEGVGND